MKRQRLYLETSIWNFLFADDAPDKKAITEKLFSEISQGKYSIYISELVMKEVNNAGEIKRRKLVGEIIKYDPIMLDDNLETADLVRFYLANNLLTENQLADVEHLAVATINEMDILVSWNMRHIVKRNTKIVVNALNQIKGYKPMDICTPEEVIENDDD